MTTIFICAYVNFVIMGANARYGIYDISCWQDTYSKWHLPRNVLIELGMAIVLNRPVLLIKYRGEQVLTSIVPECLQGVGVTNFAGDSTLKEALENNLPQWFAIPPDRDWITQFCIFGNRECGFRKSHPRYQHWCDKTLHGYVSDGLGKHAHDSLRKEIRNTFDDVFSRYSNLVFKYFDELLLNNDSQFLACNYCQAARSHTFGIYRILPDTPPEVFIVIGMSIALEKLFEYDIPKVLLVSQEQDLPSLLKGYDVIEAVGSEIKEKLKTRIPAVIQTVRETTWKPRALPFIETLPILVEKVKTPLASEDVQEESSTTGPPINQDLLRSVDELKLSVRSRSCLRNANIRTIGELVQKTETELFRIRGLGRKSLDEIKSVLAELGLSFEKSQKEEQKLLFSESKESKTDKTFQSKEKVDKLQYKRNKVFISYSHVDRKWLQRLQTYLKPLEIKGFIECWDDTKIGSSQKWTDDITNALNSTSIAIFLISSNFLASDFIMRQEIPFLLQAAEEEGVIILSIILNPCKVAFSLSILANYQTVNPPDRPLSGMYEDEQNKVFDSVVKLIVNESTH